MSINRSNQNWPDSEVTELPSQESSYVFYLKDAWRVFFNGIVPDTTWNCKGAAEAQLDLLKSGYSVMQENGVIKHRCDSVTQIPRKENETMLEYVDRFLASESLSEMERR